MADPILYGADYSTYVRTVRMALAYKRQHYSLVPVDVISGEVQGPEHLVRHPFAKVPAFHHDDTRLIETMAILRYIDLAFDGPSLEPAGAAGVARAVQVMSAAFSYAYQPFVWKVFVPGVVQPKLGNARDEATVAVGVEESAKVAKGLDGLINDGLFAGGPSLSVADLALAPLMDYLSVCPEAPQVLAGAPRLRSWWDSFKHHELVAMTRPALLG